MSKVYKNMGLDDIMPFGKKHKGKSLEQIYKEDVGYLVWLRHTRKSENGDTEWFSREMHILLDDAIKKDPQLRKKYEVWNVASLSDTDPVRAAIASAEPPMELNEVGAVIEKEKEAEFAYAENWGSY